MTEVTEKQTNDVSTLSENEKTTKKNSKKTTIPPEGYVCNLCNIQGHWIQQCPSRDKPENNRSTRSNKKRKTNTQHEHEPGKDPSPKDIEQAKKLQAIKPPLCDCGVPSRLKKVKRSHVTEGSRANGKYFFFCIKKKNDPTKCNFAQPVDETKTPKDKKQANYFAKKRRKA